MTAPRIVITPEMAKAGGAAIRQSLQSISDRGTFVLYGDAKAAAIAAYTAMSRAWFETHVDADMFKERA